MSAHRELRRLRYLSAMGEVAYVCHRSLPGARQPLRYRLNPESVTPAPQSRQSPVPAAAGSGAAAAATRAALRESLSSEPAKAAPAAPETAQSGLTQAPPTPAPAAGVRFRIAALTCGGRLWLEELGEEILAREQVQLVGAMSQALHYAGEQPSAAPQVQQFDWPMHNNPQLDSGPEEALHSLQGFLLRLLRERECTEVLCLGEDVAARIEGVGLPCPLRKLPATRSMLQDGSRKRAAWDVLKSR